MRLRLAILLIVAGSQFAVVGRGAQEDASLPKSDDDKSSHTDNSKSEPKYDHTFSGPIVEVTPTQITVSRSILGKPAEKRDFLDQVRYADRRQAAGSRESDGGLRHHR